jgi:membrane protease YdiL (CAAX protease family)
MASGAVLVLAAAGAAVAAVTWLLIRAGVVSIWTGSASTNALLAALALLTERVRGPGRLDTWPTVLLGLGAGAALYLATAAFMAVAGRWPPLHRATAEVYARRSGMSTSSVVVLAAGVVALAEEIFWRGLVQGALAAATSPLGGAALVWAVYVAVNAVSGSIPIVLGAVVGGAAWSGLAWWTGGILASLACHALWTALMIVRPPIPRTAP